MGFTIKMYAFLIIFLHAEYYTHIIFLDLIFLVIFGAD